MKLFALILGILIVLLIAFLSLNYLFPKTPMIEINGHIFNLYLAETSQDQAIGLAKYNKLEQNQGMLFLFDKGDFYSFWMKDMKFPIDIIFIQDNKVVDVFNSVPVWPNENLPVYTTKTKANKVLEINAGLANQYKIKIETIVNIKL
jgi:uncharacterized membrane protein (UPF0127 family)